MKWKWHVFFEVAGIATYLAGSFFPESVTPHFREIAIYFAISAVYARLGGIDGDKPE